MTTPHLLRWVPRILHVLETDGAALLQSLFDALVRIFSSYAEATLAYIAVKYVFSTSNATDHTFVAMKNLLLIAHIVIKTTDVAVINSEPLVAFGAGIRFRLLFTTSEAFNPSCLVAVKLMVDLWVHFCVEHHLIMAKSATVELPLANRVRALYSAPPFVMFTA